MAKYKYDAWGNCEIDASTTNNELANLNPFRYRSYYYDPETNLYFLKTRYYDPEIGRFMTIDDLSYLDPDTINGLNLYAFCGDNPVNRLDVTGCFWDYIFDAVFLVWSIIDLIKDPSNWKNWVALGIDIVFAVIPFVPSGVGQVIKIGNNVDNAVDLMKTVNNLANIDDLGKVTVIGQTMSRVEKVGQVFNATDNLYGGFKSYTKLYNRGWRGKVAAEILGKTQNAGWLYSKLRTGFTILDIGVDLEKVAEGTISSSYIMERIIVALWKTRNIWKLPLNSYF